MNELELGFLAHHGILGQKWGKRNGPPYPLGSKDHSALEEKEKWHRSLGGGRNESLYDRKESTNSNSSKPSHSENTVQTSKHTNATSEPGTKTDSKTGFNKITKPETEIERLEKCNPNYTSTRGITPYNMNCGNTVIANELRKRGLDVEARGNNWGLTVKNLQNFFKGAEDQTTVINAKIKPMNPKTLFGLMNKGLSDPNIRSTIEKRGSQVRDEFANAISSKCPDGSSGCLMITGFYGSHWISWENKNGKVTFTNPQYVKENLLLDFGTHVSSKDLKPTFLRLDNLETNNNISDVVMNRGSNADSKGMSFNPMTDSGMDFNKIGIQELKIKGKYKAAVKMGVDFERYGQGVMEQTISEYRGPMWDGSWDVFDTINKRVVKNIN